MKQKNHLRGLHVLAAAVALALGSTGTFAQDEDVAQQAGQEIEDAAQQTQDSLEGAADEAREAAGDVQSAAAGQAGGASEQLQQLAEEHDDLSTFVQAVEAAGMADALTGGTDYTLFAPTNEAFEQMSGMTTEELLQPENRQQLIDTLRAHIVADDVDEEMARNLQAAQTIDGGTIEISSEGDQLMVGQASVVDSGIEAGNLRVYAIDQVLSPSETAIARADEGLGQAGDDAASESESAGQQASPGAGELEDEAETASDELRQNVEEGLQEADEAADELDEEL